MGTYFLRVRLAPGHGSSIWLFLLTATQIEFRPSGRGRWRLGTRIMIRGSDLGMSTLVPRKDRRTWPTSPLLSGAPFRQKPVFWTVDHAKRPVCRCCSLDFRRRLQC